MYQPKKLDLHWPFDSANGSGKIETLTISLLTRETVAELSKKASDAEFNEALVKQACALSEPDFLNLRMPDMTRVLVEVTKVNFRTSEMIFGEKGQAFSKEKPQLLQPIQGDNGQEITHVSLKVPTVGFIQVMRENEKTDDQDFILSNLTSLSVNELKQISNPDAMFLSEAVNDFLNGTADSYRGVTLSI